MAESSLPERGLRDPALTLTARTLALHRRAFEAFTRPATDLILAEVGPHVSDVLDLASGIGDPALALAEQLRAGHVIACDRVPEFLAELNAEATARGLSNLRTLEADMSALPLPAASIDCVVSRLGLQFAPDPDLVLAEAARVLRPGGSMCHVVWGTPAQPLLRATVLDVLEACSAQELVVGAPGPFQFSSRGSLAQALQRAGLHDIRETTVISDWTWPGDAASLWQFTCETSAALFDPLLAKLTAAERATLERRILETLSTFARGNQLQIPVEVHCARARCTA